MRWIYTDFSTDREKRERERIVERIDAWWAEFAANTANLEALFSQEIEWDLPNWMHEHLGAIDSRLMWEYGPGLRGGHRLVITPEAEHQLRPLVQTILDRAPKLEGWAFFPYRLPEDLKLTVQTVEARTGGDISKARFQAQIGKHNRIDLVYASPDTKSEDDEQASHDAFVATETLLGEEDLDRWVGAIEVRPAAGGLKKLFARGPRLQPLDRIKPTFDALKLALREQLPPRRLCEFDFRAEEPPADAWWQWGSFEIELKEDWQPDDYPGYSDIFVAISPWQGLWMAQHGGPPFHSRRYSQFGETFCYLKLDGREGLDEQKFADRGEIEDAIDAAIVPDKLGCTIGGGTGRFYSYIELALTDVNAAFERIRKVLVDGNINPRTWLLFHDAHLADEWLGVYPHTPPPPMDNDEDP